MKYVVAVLRVILGLALITGSFLILIDPRRFALYAQNVVTSIPSTVFLVAIIILAAAIFTVGVMLSTGLRLGSLAFTALALLISIDSVLNMPRVDIYKHCIGTDESSLVVPYGQSVSAVVWDVDGMDDEYWSRVSELRRLSTDYGKSFYLLADTLSIPKHFSFSRLDTVMALRAVGKGELEVPHGQDTMYCFFMSMVKFAPRDLLREIMPSNGGAVIFTDGIIADKLPKRKIFSKQMLDSISSDADFSIADNSASERALFSGTIVLLLLSVLIINHIIQRRKLSK